MKKNAIISLAMLYALWQTKRSDLLDLIRPFVLYAVGVTTKVGDIIDVEGICRYMESEFGYQSFQCAVVERILLRETSDAVKQENRIIKKENHKFILISSLSTQVEKFNSKRIVCKEHSDAVTTALAGYLNHNRACRRDNYTASEAEVFLLSFFERQGGSIVLSADDLRQISFKNSELDFFIGKFILEENEKRSPLMDYIVELVKGYFVTTALYLQAENLDVTHASFSNVTFYLDTRLLLALLGFKSSQENESVQEMVKSLQRNGAKLACFSYNIEEVENILEAYKQSTVSPRRYPATITLEFFDERGASYTHVDAAQKAFIQRLRNSQVNEISFEAALISAGAKDRATGLLNDDELRSILLEMKPSYNVSTLPDDLAAINTVSRIRRGKRLPNIEKCKAVFVTSNPLLVSGTKQLLINHSEDVGFPLAITGNDLCVMAWLKDFERSSNLPKMRLLENVLAALTPSKELMDAYFDNVDYLEKQGDLSGDEAALLRMDQFAKKELMELTKGEKGNLSTAIVRTIREKIRKESKEEGIKIGENRGAQTLNELRTAACKQAEKEIEEEYGRKEKRWIKIIKIAAITIALLFSSASIYMIVMTGVGGPLSIATTIVALITLVQGTGTLLIKDNWATKAVRRSLQRQKFKDLDERKTKYLGLLDTSGSSPNM